MTAGRTAANAFSACGIWGRPPSWGGVGRSASAASRRRFTAAASSDRRADDPAGWRGTSSDQKIGGGMNGIPSRSGLPGDRVFACWNAVGTSRGDPGAISASAYRPCASHSRKRLPKASRVSGRGAGSPGISRSAAGRGPAGVPHPAIRPERAAPSPPVDALDVPLRPPIDDPRPDPEADEAVTRAQRAAVRARRHRHQPRRAEIQLPALSREVLEERGSRDAPGLARLELCLAEGAGLGEDPHGLAIADDRSGRRGTPVARTDGRPALEARPVGELQRRLGAAHRPRRLDQ